MTRSRRLGWAAFTGWNLAGAWLACFSAEAAEPRAGRPNIVLILADDLGYGDLGCYGATKVRTPNIDRIAREGRLFTDAHSPAAVCTPSRYALLTGREYWRLGRRWHGELLVTEGQVTLASLLKSAGYTTACLGKWHLGFGRDAPDWNGSLKPGPLEVGFDSYFGTPRPHNEPPQVYVEGHHVVGLRPDDPIRVLPPSPGYPHGTMTGGKSAHIHEEDLSLTHTAKGVEFIEKNADHPFFLYFAANGVHMPLTPNARFKGTSQCGVYGDFIQELDWSVGELLSALDRLHLAEDTLVVFSSDNGGVLHRAVVKSGHRANGALLGQKTDWWEGGHRVPFLARWPGRIPAGTRTSELVALTDMVATTASLLGKPLPQDAAPDSFDILPALLDRPGHPPVRPWLTTIGGGAIAIREGRWVFYPKHGSGGLSSNRENRTFMYFPHFWELGDHNSDYGEDGVLKPDAPPGQLYDLTADPRQSTNVLLEHPDVAKHLAELLQGLRTAQRTRP